MYVLRDMLSAIRRFTNRYTVCALRGHLSTGTFLWWMCDRCHADFASKNTGSVWVDDMKITTSPGLLRK
jgi:hypothetical protein